MRTNQDLSTARWRKSSHSDASGGDCLEVAEDLVGAARWRKSSYSGASGGNCLEVADGCTGVVPVRDSKRADGPSLVFGAAGWVAFVDAVRVGDLRTI